MTSRAILLRHRLETRVARILLRGMLALTPVRASAIMGGFLRAVGPFLPVSRVADCNLRLALPALDAAARRRVLRGMWENLGRSLGELPHLAGLRATDSGPGWEVAGREIIQGLAQAGPVIIFGAHLGNWEVVPTVAGQLGLKLGSFYRAPENKGIDALLRALRGQAGGGFFPKGAQGARQALAHLRDGGVLGVLADQKMNDGIEARFFGQPAMTASALAVLALRLRCPVVPCAVQRLGPARFRLVFEPPLPLPESGDREADRLALTQAANDRMETWIRASPESWLWLHRRWPKETYR